MNDLTKQAVDQIHDIATAIQEATPDSSADAKVGALDQIIAARTMVALESIAFDMRPDT